MTSTRSTSRSSSRHVDRSERARYDSFLQPAAARAQARTRRRAAVAVPDSIVTEAIWVARTVAIVLPALSFVLVFEGDIIDALGGIWLGIVVLGAVAALLAGLGRMAMARMGQTSVALACASIALAIPIADIAVEHRAAAAGTPDAWDDLQTLVSERTGAGDCSRITLPVAEGMTAALSCGSSISDLTTTAAYYTFAVPADVDAFYARALPSEDTLLDSGTIECSGSTLGDYAASAETVVWTNAEKRLVAVAQRGNGSVDDDLAAWDLRVCG
jgi:hypothetical protein